MDGALMFAEITKNDKDTEIYRKHSLLTLINSILVL